MKPRSFPPPVLECPVKVYCSFCNYLKINTYFPHSFVAC